VPKSGFHKSPVKKPTPKAENHPDGVGFSENFHQFPFLFARFVKIRLLISMYERNNRYSE